MRSQKLLREVLQLDDSDNYQSRLDPLLKLNYVRGNSEESVSPLATDGSNHLAVVEYQGLA